MGAFQSQSTDQTQTAQNHQEEILQSHIRSLSLASEPDYAFLEKSHNDGRQNRPGLGQNIGLEAVGDWMQSVLKHPKNRLAISALSTNPLANVLTQASALVINTQTFNICIPHEGSPVTNQQRSGRCWIFASCNVFRVPLMEKYNLKSFQLSQGYLFFWDKLEKSNYFLETVIETANEPLDGRLLQTLLGAPVGDGGQFDMIHNLVSKYGLVPQELYPSSYNSNNSQLMDGLITTKLREHCLVLRELVNNKSISYQAIRVAKDEMMKEIHLILTIMLGPPPMPTKKFTWNFTDASNKFHSVNKTPLEFAAQLRDPKAVRVLGGTDVTRLKSIVNDPRHEYFTKLTVDRLGNVWNAPPVTYINVDMETMKQACIAQLKAGVPIFFGSDVGKDSNLVFGVLDPALIDYKVAFNTTLNMNKAQRLRVGESAMTHAMVLTAVHVVDGKPVRWRIQNSWGEVAGQKGWFMCTDTWFDKWVYQAVIDPSFLSDKVMSVLDKEPLVLPLWDPMGALA